MKIDLLIFSFSVAALIVLIMGLVLGVAPYVNPDRSFHLVYETEVNDDFRTAIGVWALMAFWLAVLSAKKYFPNRVYKLLSFGMDSKLSIHQMLFTLISASISLYALALWV
jgi:hypothetical protein